MLFNRSYAKAEKIAFSKDYTVLCCLFLNHNLIFQVGARDILLGQAYYAE